MQKTEEELEKQYKRNLSFLVLKNGKTPRRKGLLKTLCYLSGLGGFYRGVDNTGFSNKNNFNRTASIIFNIYNHDTFIVDFILGFFKKTCDSFLKKSHVEYDVLDRKLYIELHYNSDDIKWYLIDENLKSFHKENSYERNGFMYVYNMKFLSEQRLNVENNIKTFKK